MAMNENEVEEVFELVCRFLENNELTYVKSVSTHTVECRFYKEPPRILYVGVDEQSLGCRCMVESAVSEDEMLSTIVRANQANESLRFGRFILSDDGRLSFKYYHDVDHGIPDMDLIRDMVAVTMSTFDNLYDKIVGGAPSRPDDLMPDDEEKRMGIGPRGLMCGRSRLLQRPTSSPAACRNICRLGGPVQESANAHRNRI